jgi:hypothetical protein
MKTVTRVVVSVLLCLVAACAPAAPTPMPTPEPTPTPIWILATRVEHLVGVWVGNFRWHDGIRYERREADGTIWAWYEQGVDEVGPRLAGRFWFEDGVCYEEEGDICSPVGSYRVYLEIVGGSAVGLRFEVIDDWEPECVWRLYARRQKWTRVDRWD